MVEYTSISVRKDVERRFSDLQPDNLNRTEFVERLLNQYDPDSGEALEVNVMDIDELQEELERLEREVNLAEGNNQEVIAKLEAIESQVSNVTLEASEYRKIAREVAGELR